MALQIPAYTFQDMLNLCYVNNMAMWQVFPDELVIAICWEETQFNNIKQLVKGTAVGLGQVEPSELSKLKQYGVYHDSKSILNDPANAIEATSYMLMHGYVTNKAVDRRKEALRRYAGYYKDKAGWRLTVIDGWERCERALQAIPDPKFGYPDKVLDALGHAKGFKNVRSVMFKALFPGR